MSFEVRSHTIPATHIREYAAATAAEDDILYLAVKQYVPRDACPRGHLPITIIGAHANAFPKELYEPLWEDLSNELLVRGIWISTIFIADAAHQGESGVLNDGKLGNDPSWMDNPRDLFLMVNHFRTEMVRPIIGIGHSMGGNNLVNLSLMHPRLFAGLILIDPVIQRWPNAGNFAPAQLSIRRRDRWPSRKAAETAFRKSPFYQAWDPRVFDRWVKYGLRELPTALYPVPATEGEVTLTTTKHQEVLTFLRLRQDRNEAEIDEATPTNSAPFYRPESVNTFLNLPHLRPNAFYIYGGESALSTPASQSNQLSATGTGIGGSGGVARGRVKHVTFSDLGHMIPMEAVDRTAKACADWLGLELKWWHAEKKIQDERRASNQNKSTASEEYVRLLNSDWQGKTKL
ncbi:alpha/beta-hydrolase [Piedraia hortae CBS 480.64]|uniref:Alpha/beta-hydrolase n=1 Tax=Piedraia hortae CBS 480.64 TaxID=1314780 RepID=A0A6A7C6F5_9PEZI|nr:alpha/beta-hydrolase [Piedraia hortae CBS 480.64]